MKTFKVGLFIHGVEIHAETEGEALQKFLDLDWVSAQIEHGDYYPSIELIEESGK